MKKIIRLTESDLHRIVRESVKRILREDVLGNDWNVANIGNNDNITDVSNNYEAFEDQKTTPFNGMTNDHDWSVKGEDGDPTHYDNYTDDIENGHDDWPEDRILDRIDTNANYDDFPPMR